MSIADIVTMGYGSFGSVNDLPTLGYGTSAATPVSGPAFCAAAQVYRPGAMAAAVYRPGMMAGEVTP